VSEHIDEELPLVLTGEADQATVQAVVNHLRECPDCTQELLSLLVAHASLASAARFAPEVRTGPVSAPPEAPATAPDLSAVFAQIRAEVDADTASPTTTRTAPTAAARRHHPARWLAAAAAVIVIGGGTAVIVEQTSSSGPSKIDVALAAYGVGQHPAQAVVTGDQMKLDAASLPAPPAGELYEVWLTDAQRTSMHPLGWIGANGTGTYTVPATLMNHFSAIEVSVQKVAAPDGYSGTSVLRGVY